MLLQPKNRKFRKDKKSFIKKNNKGKQVLAKSHRLEFGSYGLKTLESNILTAAQLEAIRRVMIRDLRKIGYIRFRIFPCKPITSKPLKTRMGKGKGSVQYWAAPIKAGQILFEINGSISHEIAKTIIKKASQKLQISTKFVAYNTAKVLTLV